MVDMIDVSNFNPNPDFNAIHASGVQTIYTHAFEYGPNTQSFPGNWSGIRSTGMQRGAYCFGRPDAYSGAEAANQTIDWVVSHGFDGTDFFVLDAEVPMTADWAVDFLSTTRGRGYPVALYASTSYLFDVLGADPRLSSYPLIVADYGPNDGSIHPISRTLPWPPWAHQYTSVGSVPGVVGNVDCNVFVDNNLNPAHPQPPTERFDDVVYLEENGKYWVMGFGDYVEIPQAVGIGVKLNGGTVVPIKTAERITMGVEAVNQAKSFLTSVGLIH